MKKILSLLLAVMLCTSILCACNSQTTDETTPSSTQATSSSQTVEETTISPTAYKGNNPDAPDAETVVKAFMDNMDKWNIVPEYCNWNGYLFLDLNFDGTLELVVTANSGSGQFSDNRYYSFNENEGGITELSFSDKIEDLQSDFFFSDYPKLYKNNETGEMRYIFRDHIRPTGWEYSDAFEEFFASETEINTNKLWATYCTGTDSSGEVTSEYTYYLYDENGDSTQVDEDTYNKKIAEYEDAHTELSLHFEVVHGTDFNEADKDAQQELLLSSYKAFYY
ncbi:MAG: hypothetical protein IJ298_00180 [Ruminococcus sp.]|nr:hypothetical protein [Ruminococcus sp.]